MELLKFYGIPWNLPNDTEKFHGIPWNCKELLASSIPWNCKILISINFIIRDVYFAVCCMISCDYVSANTLLVEILRYHYSIEALYTYRNAHGNYFLS